jgi:acetyltransferase-like isoleucine patch superfamily enzyme
MGNKIKFFYDILLNSPWKVFSEIIMYLLKPWVSIYLEVMGVDIGSGSKFYGRPKILRYRGSKIKIGDRFENRNWWSSNPLGINHPTIICTWAKGAKLEIGNDVGISGGSLVASKSITIGDGTLIGANTLIIDSNFHPLKSQNRRYDKKDIKSSPIKIGKNVFIGTNCTILKGAVIPDNAIVPAGAVVRK